jgi:hypothetical protein
MELRSSHTWGRGGREQSVGVKALRIAKGAGLEQWVSQLAMFWMYKCCQYGLEEVAYLGFHISRRSNA